MPTLHLVGAGPGDAELITIKGLNAIKKADVILYDALIDKTLLSYASPSCVLVDVGKRAGEHTFPQSQIHEHILKYAQQYNNIVRLKGGDPFIFGRGHEEMQFALQHHINVNIIPGVSSTTAIPTLIGLPLSRRGFAESYWVITACNKEGELSRDLLHASQTNATIVILMGVKKLPAIAQLFIQKNRGEAHIAIIENGSTPQQKITLGLIKNIVLKASENNVKSPAIIIIGEVVKFIS